MMRCRLPILAMIGLTGCSTLAPDYTKPDAPVPAAWSNAPAAVQGAAAKAVADIPWREFFVEPRLQKVIDLALNNNRDLRVAILTIEKTRALYQVQGNELIPQINATAGASMQRQPADLTGSGQAKISRQYSVGLGVVNYELDLFGRVRSLKAQALEEYLATEEARRAVQISLVAEVANAWLNLAADRERLRLARETYESQQKSLELIRRRYELGVSSELDLRQAQSRVEAARGDSALYSGRALQSENALNLVAGTVLPSGLLPTEVTSVTAVRELPAGLPSEVLLRRPDILAAEHRLKGLQANIGAARAAFFPRIGLSASFGTASARLTDLFQPGSVAWNFVPQISVPLFDAGSNKANLEAAKKEREIALARYEKAIQGAFREVADTLASSATLSEQLSAQQAFAEASNQSYRLAEARYARGVDGYLATLDAQRSTYGAQQGLISIRLAHASNLVTLYKVLGGGGN